ncbi:hypothetical protein RhiJN_09048 [Ceratobasidium sp. AG-Ba]|nr:hypothetical protein RhiJN_09048 [Ceratobasidium sp. AG-Ba]
MTTHKVGPYIPNYGTGSEYETSSDGTLHNTCEISQGIAKAPAGSATFSSCALLHHQLDSSADPHKLRPDHALEAYLNSNSLALQETPSSLRPDLEAGVLGDPYSSLTGSLGPLVDQGNGVSLPACQSFESDLGVLGMRDIMAELACQEQLFPATTFDPYGWGTEYHTATNKIQTALDAVLGQGMLYHNA